MAIAKTTARNPARSAETIDLVGTFDLIAIISKGYGRVLPKPGDETAWFDHLPESLQDYMKKLGTTREAFTL